MPSVTLKKACELTSKSKRTIQRYMANGKLSYSTNSLGHKEIDTSELIRVFGELSPLVTDKVRPDDTPILSPHNNDDRISNLLTAVERLETIVKKQSEQIASLLQLEHKPTIASKVEPEKPVKEMKTGSSYLYNMSFVKRK